MAFLRTAKRFSLAPPPSPVATAKGTRSAAINDKIFTEFLNKSLKVPDLVLPNSQSLDGISLRNPVEIDLISLLSKDDASVHRLLSAAEDSGVFLLVGNGIPADELRSALAEADRIFTIPEEKKRVLIRNFGGKDDFGVEKGIRQEFRWVRSEKAAVEASLEDSWSESYPTTFSEELENISYKLEMIAMSVGEILKDYVGKELHNLSEGTVEPLICLYKFNNDNMEATHSSSINQKNIKYEGSSHDLTLHFSNSELEFRVQSHNGSLCFSSGAGSLIVTTGKRIQEWSENKFESIICEPIYEPGVDDDPSFYLAFKCSLSSQNRKVIQEVKTITLIDQLLIFLTILALYNFIAYLYAKYVHSYDQCV